MLTRVSARSIPLRNRIGVVVAYALVDEVDFDHVSQFRWHLTKYGYVESNYWVEGRCYSRRLHREVLGLSKDDPRRVDHRDRNKQNCRRGNLRLVGGHRENNQNVGANRGSSSPYRGVSWHPDTGKWMARATLNSKSHYLGVFSTQEEAAKVASAWRAINMPFSEEGNDPQTDVGRIHRHHRSSEVH